MPPAAEQGDRPRRQWAPDARALSVVGDRWVMVIVRDLASGPLRLEALRRWLPGVSAGALESRLSRMAEAGLIVRRRRRSLPPRVDLELTERGHALVEAIGELARWELRTQWSQTARGRVDRRRRLLPPRPTAPALSRDRRRPPRPHDLRRRRRPRALHLRPRARPRRHRAPRHSRLRRPHDRHRGRLGQGPQPRKPTLQPPRHRQPHPRRRVPRPLQGLEAIRRQPRQRPSESRRGHPKRVGPTLCWRKYRRCLGRTQGASPAIAGERPRTPPGAARRRPAKGRRPARPPRAGRRGHRAARALLAVGGVARQPLKGGGGPGVEDVEHPPISTAPGPHPIATLRVQACCRPALPVVMRRASMRWPVGASVALVRPVQEDGGREPAHTAITDRQVMRDRVPGCRNELRLSACVQQRASRSRALTFGNTKNCLNECRRSAPATRSPSMRRLLSRSRGAR